MLGRVVAHTFLHDLRILVVNGGVLCNPRHNVRPDVVGRKHVGVRGGVHRTLAVPCRKTNPLARRDLVRGTLEKRHERVRRLHGGPLGVETQHHFRDCPRRAGFVVDLSSRGGRERRVRSSKHALESAEVTPGQLSNVLRADSLDHDRHGDLLDRVVLLAASRGTTPMACARMPHPPSLSFTRTGRSR
jgi:hypothetical protein